jgi:wyosine [tRNA(Phe)-imidazoG37] synthetase (radical SAM superfamily)
MIPLVSVSDSPIIKYPAKNLQNKYCLSPFVMIEINLHGQVRLCGCSAWMDTTIGNIYESSLPDLLSSDLAKKIRQSIIDGTYEYCNEKTCGIIRNNQLLPKDNLPDAVKHLITDSSQYQWPLEIYLSADLTCNLSCPSCRSQVFKATEQEQARLLENAQILKNNLFAIPTQQEINLMLSTSSELFASNMLMTFVSSISAQDFPNVFLNIQTNGLLCEKNWHRLGALGNRVKKITVTIDAAEAETYERLRRGGQWDQIQAAMAWLSEKKQSNGMKLHTRIVVQKDNCTQLKDFYNMSQRFGVDVVEYSRIHDWATMSKQEFEQIDVLNPEHPDHAVVVAQLDQVKNLHNVLTWG